jgi:hypothetical protein
MRFAMLVIGAAALLLMPAGSATAASPGAHKAQSTEFSAAKKKARKRKAEKVEYMRAVPSK